MKPAATVLAAGLLALSGCGGDNDDRAAAPTDTTAEQTTSAPAPPAQEPADEAEDKERSKPAKPAPEPTDPLPAPTPTGGGADPLTDGAGPGSKPALRRTDLDNPGTGRGRPVGRSPGSTLAADRRAVLRVMRTFAQSLGSGDTVQACAQLTQVGRRRLERRIWKVAPEVDTLPCVAALPVYRSAYGDELAAPQFKKVSVSPSRASAVGPGSEAFVLVKHNGLWLIDRYGSR